MIIKIFTATALSAIIGCTLMAFLANYPIGIAPGLGDNAGVLILPKFARPTPKVGAKLGIEETILSGIGIKPVTRPKSVVAKIPIKIEPGLYLDGIFS